MVAALAKESSVDLYLSGAGRGDGSRCIVGYSMISELIVDADTTQDGIAAFCFGTQEPALGFISYEYGMLLRGVASVKQGDFPLGHLKKYAAYMEFDLGTQVAQVYGRDLRAVDALAAIAQGVHDECSVNDAFFSGSVRQSLTRAEYESGVERTLEFIRAGHSYQLNLSIRFERQAESMDSGALLARMWQTHPAPYYVLFHSGPYEILSTSPERFLKVEDGKVLSQPIKGTLSFDTYTPGLEKQIVDSQKESAELSMIVDLVRNDISYNCEYGSVAVEGHKSTFVVDQLIQMYSNVTGMLRDDRTCLDLFFDAFPGGSITGCPKRRSMEIIEELEPHRRDVYCGSFVVVRGKRDMDSSIAIRTGWLDARTDVFTFCAGSGIVVDSDPASEYAETVSKAAKFLESAG